jgi:hypothetical protein
MALTFLVVVGNRVQGCNSAASVPSSSAARRR